jgi:hypothetical protein
MFGATQRLCAALQEMRRGGSRRELALSPDAVALARPRALVGVPSEATSHPRQQDTREKRGLAGFLLGHN